MKAKNIFIVICLIMFSDKMIAQEAIPLYRNPKAQIEERVADLLSRMTLEEKIFQLNQSALGNSNNPNNMGEIVKDISPLIGSLIYTNDNPLLSNSMQKKAIENTRLGIPILFGFDVIHGFRTIYPISLGQACSWNPDLVKQACKVAAQESYDGGVNWTFSPMVDVARDARWGRVSEGYGEDPYTNAVFGLASIEGYQGEDLSNKNNIAACLKHYVGYGTSIGGRDYSATEISKQTLWDTYMLPFEIGIKGGAATVMSSFNDISGVPATANHYILTDILKKRWNHDGFVVSDWNSIIQLIPQGVAENKKEAALKAFVAGVEMDMADNIYMEYLEELIEEGKVSLNQVDDAVSRVLRLKFRLGLFENPYTEELPENRRVLLPSSMDIVKKLTEESIVLLKNSGQILPLSAKRVAVIGPMAKNAENLLGAWSAHGRINEVETIFMGIGNEFKNKTEFQYSLGCDFEGSDTSHFAEALSIAEQSEVVLLCLGEKRTWSGENASRSKIELPQIQEQLVLELKKSGKPIILILSSGRPIALGNIEPFCNAILAMWQPGITGGTALAGILSGRINPSGKLAITFPLASGQIPIYYNERQRARPDQGLYQDIPTLPLYLFTHGLSYTNFSYGELIAAKTVIKKNEQCTVSINVANIGSREGAETVHWFISDPVSSISRPEKELKFFEKKVLKPGQNVIFTFNINPMRDLSFVDDDGNKFLESGTYFIKVKNKQIKIKIID